MANSQKTGIGLNIWAGGDRPKRADFNSDNEIVSAKLSSFSMQEEYGMQWNPIVASGGVKINSGQFLYNRIGRLVDLGFRFDLEVTDSNNAEQISFSGLPFPPQTSGAHKSDYLWLAISSTGRIPMATLNLQTGTLLFYAVSNTSQAPITASMLTSATGGWTRLQYICQGQ